MCYSLGPSAVAAACCAFANGRTDRHSPTMHDQARLFGLLDCLYAAPGSATGWHTFLEQLRLTLGGSGASVISHDLSVGSALMAATTFDDAAMQRAYEERWGQLDPWAHAPATRTLSTGAVAIGERLVARQTLERTEFYNEFGRFLDLNRCAVMMVEQGPHVMSGLSVNGSMRMAFDNDDVALLRALAPHAQRALQLHRRLMGAEAHAMALTEAVDRLPHGVVLVDRSAGVLGTNTAADTILAAHDGLDIDGCELRAGTNRDTRELRTIIVRCATAAADGGIDASGVLQLHRPSGRRPLQVVVAPLARRGLAGTPAGAAIVYVTDPERLPLPTADDLRDLFGLTAAEARLALALVRGETLAEASQASGVRLETSRKRVKEIFVKTGTHRQAELVRVLIQSTPLR